MRLSCKAIGYMSSKWSHSANAKKL
jgi:hypothetical protein